MYTEQQRFHLSLSSHRLSRSSQATYGRGSQGSLPSPIARIASPSRAEASNVDHSESNVRASPKSHNDLSKKKQTWVKMMYECDGYRKGYKHGLYPLASFLHHFATSVDGGSSPTMKTKNPPKLSLWLPDTIVWDKGPFPTWYYTDEHGHLVRTSLFSLEDVYRRFKQRGDSGKTVVIAKYPAANVRNSCKLASAARLQAMLPKLFEEHRAGVSIQRYVEFRNRPCLLRCRWRRHANALEIHYIIRNDATTPTSADESCLVSISEYVSEKMRDDSSPKQRLEIQTVGGHLRSELSDIMDHIISFLATYRNLLFQELVCDFTRDKMNRLWFLQVKAFVPWQSNPTGMVVGPGVWLGEPQESGDRARCGFCECTFRRCDLQYTLNARQLHAMHDRLQHWNNPLSWSAAESQLLSRDATSYQCFPVCADCNDLHSTLDDVVNAGAMLGAVLGDESARVIVPTEAEDTSIYPELFAKRQATSQAETLRIARLLSEGRTHDTRGAAGNLSSKSSLNPFSRSSSCPQFFRNTRDRMNATHLAKRTPQMPEGWQLDLPSNTTQVVASASKPTYLRRFRILLLIQVSAAALGRLQDEVDEHGMLALAWTMFGMERCVALPQEHNVGDVGVVFNAIGTQHFYARCIEDVVKCVDSCSEITIFIVAAESGQRLGCMTVDLHHVVRNQIELHHIEVPVRGWSSAISLTATLGFTAGVLSNCEHFDLRAHMGDLIYVPPAGVVIPELLPKSWQALVTGSSDVLQRSDL